MTGKTDTDNHGNQPGDLMDITAVAARLGVTVRHVRRLVHERRIPYIKPAGTQSVGSASRR